MNLNPRNHSSTPTIVDLFCGAGGMSLGFAQAGFNCIGAYDAWAAAVNTFNTNLVPHAQIATIDQRLLIPKATIIVGGPPCQGFSSAGMRRTDDARNSLVSVFANLIAAAKPEAFVFENVEGFLTASGGNFIRELLEPLVTAGYRIHLRKINAANYGVPQHRKRVIAIGGLGWTPSFPKPTHSAVGAPGAFSASERLPFAPSLGEALASLPTPDSIPPGIPKGHFREALHGRDLERARHLKQGQTMRDLPSELWHDSYHKRAFRRVMDGMPTEKRGGAPAGLRRLDSTLPSKAITGGALSEFLHPTEDRPLTIRECARLQSFPDNFSFVGTTAEQMQLIGNAVPPLLAQQIAMSVLADLRRIKEPHQKGALCSFIPTASGGKSPALQRVVDMVNSIFENRESMKQTTLWH